MLFLPLLQYFTDAVIICNKNKKVAQQVSSFILLQHTETATQTYKRKDVHYITVQTDGRTNKYTFNHVNNIQHLTCIVANLQMLYTFLLPLQVSVSLSVVFFSFCLININVKKRKRKSLLFFTNFLNFECITKQTYISQ